MRRFLPICVVLSFLFAIVPVAHADSGSSSSVLFGSSTVIQEGDTVEDIVIFGGDLDIRGRVNGDVVSMGGKVLVTGEVTGDIVSIGGGTDLKSTAVVDGNLVVFGGYNKEMGARIGGTTREIKPERNGSPAIPAVQNGTTRSSNPLFDLLARVVRFVVVSISLLAVSLLIVLFFPARVELVKETVLLSPLWCSAVGILTIMVGIVLSPVLAISLIGIPLIPVMWLAVTAGVFVGFVGLGQLVGERLFDSLKIRRSVPFLTILSGTIFLVAFVAILSGAFSDCLGIIAITLVSVPGLGGVVLTRFGTTIPNLPRR